MIERSREADAFLTCVDQAAPQAVSACEGWTTHEIAAHVTGIAIEVLRHLDPYLQGDPVPKTRSFEEREAPLQAMNHDALLNRLDAEEQRMRAVVGDILAREPDAVIPWTGRQMAVAKFIPHLRNEHALHRWDVAGDDDTSLTLLADTDLRRALRRCPGPDPARRRPRARPRSRLRLPRTPARRRPAGSAGAG